MPTNKERIMFIVDAQTRGDLEQWADEEGKSVSSLVAGIIKEVIAAKKQKTPVPSKIPETIHELVKSNFSKLKRETGIKTLKQIAEGTALPTKPDFRLIMTTLDLPEEVQKKLWFNTYNNGNNKENSTNALS